MTIARRTLACSCLLFATGIAGTVHAVGTGGRIPKDLASTSGTLTSDIVIATSARVATGNSVTVNLLGAQHDWSGDLIVTLSYIVGQGHTTSVDILNRVGTDLNHLYGSAADFGDGTGAGDNYFFNTDYPGDLGATTGHLGDADVIPGVTNDSINGGQYFPSSVGGAKTNLSYVFAGADLAVDCDGLDDGQRPEPARIQAIDLAASGCLGNSSRVRLTGRRPAAWVGVIPHAGYPRSSRLCAGNRCKCQYEKQHRQQVQAEPQIFRLCAGI